MNDSIIGSDHFEENLSQHLNQFNEPPLNRESRRSYRLFVFHSFSEGEWIYRCFEADSGYFMVVKKQYNYHFIEPGFERPDTSYFVEIGQDEWQTIEKEVKASCFWVMPFKIEHNGLDGTTYTLEAYDPTKATSTARSYHVVTRWSPPDSTTFKKLCQTFLNIGDGIQNE